MTILGISIGTSQTGICVLQDDILLERHVHYYHRVWSGAKLHTLVNRYRRYILKHQVTAIMVKIPPLEKHTPAVTRLLKRVERLAKKYNCLYDLITKSELKHVTGMRSTRELIDYTRRLYPELSSLYDKGRLINHPYDKKLFEAVLSAHVFKERQHIRARRIAQTTE
jgi:hypothetical protein